MCVLKIYCSRSFLGINGNTLRCFSNYLLGRKQCVDINGIFSHLLLTFFFRASHQGTFYSYVISMTCIQQQIFSLFMFADYTFYLTSDSDLMTLVNNVNKEIIKLQNWSCPSRFRRKNEAGTKYIRYNTVTMNMSTSTSTSVSGSVGE